MQKVHSFIRSFILAIIDIFYPLFKKLMPLETFRYAACGGFNTSLDIFLFFVSYNYIFQKQVVHLPYLALKAHNASFLVSFCITFPIGFYLSRYVVFQETSTRKATQLTRYLMVVLACLLLNYVFLKLFVDVLGWYPTPSKLVTTVFVVMFSYFSQKNFTFKAKANS